MTTARNNVSAASETGSPAARWALASLSLSVLLSSLGTSIANVALPRLAEVFQAPFGQIQWVVLAYLLAITTLIVSAGRLGDLIGHRRLLLIGLVLFAAGSAASGLAPGLPSLIAARAVQGLGAAVMMALAMALVGGTVSSERTGSAMGLLGTMSAVGTALGPTLGGVLIAGAGWRAIFLVTVPLALLTLGLAWRTLPADARKASAERPRLDMVGTALLAATLAAYALAMTLGRGDFGTLNIALLAGAALGTLLFVLSQTRVSAPLIRLSAFRDGTFSSSLAVNAVVATVMMATLIVGPFYLAQALGLNAAMVGLAMSVGPIIAALSGVPAGRLVDRLGAPTTVRLGLGVMAAGSFGLAILPALFGLAGYIAAIALLTPGYQLFQAANNTSLMQGVDKARRGVISGLLNLSRNLGLITGASLMGAVFAAAAGASDISQATPDAVAGGMQVTFGLAGLLVVGAFLLAASTAMRRKTIS
ncbi:MFS transporter [Stappia taiwanensis]|uniref:MFS transporter n=1 Tax=Stappia taiwanensis TaxID=992267 RepID=A0A838XPB0_9HYPH|nr:MFS transporter [Stappia taiwanensis]MBA4611627.1 MFS transporter [Stappia taiwanensis]GGE98043.1 MFS transporter [Stappia taiwanensis]